MKIKTFLLFRVRTSVNPHLKTFASSVSHDLREPLYTIAMSAQHLKRSCGNRLEPDEAGFLARILTAVDRMLALLRDLEVYTEAVRHAEEPRPAIDSARVLADVLEILSAPIEVAAATVTSASLPLVSMHEPRLARVFQNLDFERHKIYVQRAAAYPHFR